jgi:hypothetical protein
MEDQQTAAALRELTAELRAQNAAREGEAAERSAAKDRWDKFANVSTFLSSVVIAAVGLVFTSCYNMRQADRERDERRQQLAVQQVEIVQKFMPQLTGAEDEKKLALLAISALGNTKLATDLAALDKSSGSQEALEAIAASPDSASRTLAQRALANFRRNASVFSGLRGGSAVGRAALEAARKEAQAGSFEVGGDNRGPRVRAYLQAVGQGEGVGWSAAFVSWCYVQAKSPPVFRPSGSFAEIENEMREKGWLHLPSGYAPEPGDVVFFGGPASDRPRHGGIVVRATRDSLFTVEGNAGDAGDQRGLMVLVRERPLAAARSYGHVPD